MTKSRVCEDKHVGSDAENQESDLKPLLAQRSYPGVGGPEHSGGSMKLDTKDISSVFSLTLREI